MLEKSWGALCLAGVVVAGTVTGCGQQACDSMLRRTDVSIDFSRLGTSWENLEYTVNCPGQESCVYTPDTDTKRHAAVADNPLWIAHGTKTMEVTVYLTGSSTPLAKTTAELEWDPPFDPSGCSTTATANFVV
ncbi:hypothetical protein SAMN04487917_109104 [Arthrobacter sp. yr096]|nr:hypothetical protein SAMN04487917_109104 [Arthrobacter sp. yr096]